MRNEKELLVDCLQRLNGCGIPYMLTGSMASNFWGIPRTTHDLDFVLVMQPADVPAFVSAFEGDFFLQAEAIEDAFQPPYQFNAIDEHSALKVDFWVLHENEFEQMAFSRRLQVTLFGISARIATAEDVILLKLYWYKITPSERQLADVAGVYTVQANSLDRVYLRRWAPILGVEAELADLEAGKIRPKTT